MDSNGDGVGDLEGIRRRLDHLRWLGIDGVWLSPIFPSPMKDFGYDVSDYCDVDPLFGTLADLDRLVADAHARDLRLILDWVPNHSSDQHDWFRESRSSRESPRRDWYVWRDARPDGSLPNNWISNFGGPAWEWDAKTAQYYLHMFLKEQPDLNWRNPEVVAAMHDVLRFWLDRGVDGFRIDVVTTWTIRTCTRRCGRSVGCSTPTRIAWPLARSTSWTRRSSGSTTGRGMSSTWRSISRS
jgi:glycosidase